MYCDVGVLGHWCTGMSEYYGTDMLGCQNIEILVYWDVGVLGYWCTGIRSTRILVYWYVGVLGY